MNKVLLEICCGSADDVLEAYRGGADRVELNSCLFFGGLTPSVGELTVVKRRVPIPVMTMVRPRQGAFAIPRRSMKPPWPTPRPCWSGGPTGWYSAF